MFDLVRLILLPFSDHVAQFIVVVGSTAGFMWLLGWFK